ncbi:MAG: hypothetical protein RBS73_10565 [Prolixibacteraceae bacterium]|jgi:hypothetical protein|nr:hypothetical protein [Prolixibacteraceae bacterium]
MQKEIKSNYILMMNCHDKTKGRRDFLKFSLIGGISFFSLPLTAGISFSKKNQKEFELSLQSPTRFFDGNFCWAHPRAGIVPHIGKNSFPHIVMTVNKLDLSGSDIFRGIYGMETKDMGKNWTEPKEIKNLSAVGIQLNDIEQLCTIADFWPTWHKHSQKLMGIGKTFVYTKDWEKAESLPPHIAYSIYNPDNSNWIDLQELEIPDYEKFHNANAGCVQRFDLPDGTILLPITFRPPGKNSAVIVVHCSFDGKILKYLRCGNELSIDNDTRGLGEPSLTWFNGEFFLTIRNDKEGFVTRSGDGLHFDPIKPWKFDDGTDLGNYNTQQHWVTHSDGLFLVYTRRGANNDHVFRHRAPLFIARVDPERLWVIRATEQILVPERGARLGNFGVTDVSKNETWVTVSEWMQPRGVEKYGSDGSVFVARIHWNKPNRLFK